MIRNSSTSELHCRQIGDGREWRIGHCENGGFAAASAACDVAIPQKKDEWELCGPLLRDCLFHLGGRLSSTTLAGSIESARPCVKTVRDPHVREIEK